MFIKAVKGVVLIVTALMYSSIVFGQSSQKGELSFTSDEQEDNKKFIRANYQANQEFVNDYFKKGEKKKRDGVTCSFCKSPFKAFKAIFGPKMIVKIFRYVVAIPCSFALNKDICLSAIDRYGETVAGVVINKVIDEKLICSKMKLCPNKPYEYFSHNDYAEFILKDKPNRNQEEADLTAKTWTMLQFTDIHYDPHYKEGSKADCPIPICCRPDSTSSNNITAGKYGYLGKCDANKELFQSFLDKAYDLQPDFMIWTGDNSPHDFWIGTQEEIFNATQLLVDMINAKFNHSIPIYPILGNHEKYPTELFHGEEAYMLSTLALIYKHYLSEEAFESFKHYGYYSILHKDTNLRIVALNCLLCDSLNFHLITDHSQILQMLAWFEETLRYAEANGEIVYLLDHIPFISHFYMNECAKRMIALFDRFQYTIRSYFSGHTHTDEMGVIHKYHQRNEPISVSFIAPALSPYKLFNPSFRLYEIDSKTKAIKDYLQFRLYLSEANKERKANWRVSYRATELFKVKHLTDYRQLEKILVEGEYIKKKYADGPYGDAHAHDAKTIRTVKCKLQSDSFEDYIKCNYGKSPFHKELLFVVLNKLIGQLKE